MWKNLNNRKVCQGIIPFGQMSFKCYTCFSNYSICHECFDPQKHQGNHKCLIFYDQKICICGNTSISPQQAFKCQKHEELDQFNELEKIPEQLQLRLKKLIKAICKGYIKYISLIQQQLYKYDIIVMKLNRSSFQGKEMNKNG